MTRVFWRIQSDMPLSPRILENRTPTSDRRLTCHTGKEDNGTAIRKEVWREVRTAVQQNIGPNLESEDRENSSQVGESSSFLPAVRNYIYYIDRNRRRSSGARSNRGSHWPAHLLPSTSPILSSVHFQNSITYIGAPDCVESGVRAASAKQMF